MIYVNNCNCAECIGAFLPLEIHNLAIYILNTGPALMNFKPTTTFCGWFWITSLIWYTYWTPA